VLDSPLLSLPSLRRHVLRGLADTQSLGTLAFTRGRTAEMRLGENWMVSVDVSEADAKTMPQGATRNVRLCDLYATTLSKITGFPAFEPYWSLDARDAAIDAIVRFVRQYGARFRGEEVGSRVVFERLDRPATWTDVREGRAIFSLDGETRVVPLERFPSQGTWKTKPKEDQHVRIWQAEEVLVNGVWRRYYGVVARHRLARVPAEEIHVWSW
jgi:hypothetical protein